VNRPDPDPAAGPGGFLEDLAELRVLYLATRRADLARLGPALEAGDFETLRRVGHAFKGSSAPFGFEEAGLAGAALEEAALRGDRGECGRLVEQLRAALGRGDPAGH
jgi:HPt (histidine-containing phosphotransfer) domain-containing protein